MNTITAAAIQMNCQRTVRENISRAEMLVRQAASEGAQVIVLPELFERPYFCQERRYEYYGFARPALENDAVKRFLEVTKELRIVLPVSFYERDGNRTYNSAAILDSGSLLGIYRKTHIPDDHYYQEKFYFAPGNTGFRVWDTSVGKIGVGICWDQWFPEAARCMALEGAELLLYPTAIGSEPILGVDSSAHWQRVMQGHAAANIVPAAAANRIGTESVSPCKENGGQKSSLTFYGHSFITDETGEIEAEAGPEDETIILAEFEPKGIEAARMEWGLYRDRRPEMYGKIME